MTVLEIVEKYLKDNGFDGLFDQSQECACDLSNLQPCSECFHECEPGYKFPCTCGEHDWHIGTKTMKDEAEKDSIEIDTKIKDEDLLKEHMHRPSTFDRIMESAERKDAFDKKYEDFCRDEKLIEERDKYRTLLEEAVTLLQLVQKMYYENDGKGSSAIRSFLARAKESGIE